MNSKWYEKTKTNKLPQLLVVRQLASPIEVSESKVMSVKKKKKKERERERYPYYSGELYHKFGHTENLRMLARDVSSG